MGRKKGVKRLSEEFYSNCGKILNAALGVESNLEFFISNFFCYPQDSKTFLFNDLMVSGLGFGVKKDLFNSIVKKVLLFENTKVFVVRKLTKEQKEEDKKNLKELSELNKDIEFVQKIRNFVAHRERYFIDSKFILQSKKSTKYLYDNVEINEKIVKEIQEKSASSAKRIYSFLTKVQSKKTPFFDPGW
ncbi:hypothetical protein COS64_01145 [archaeon CG06_land_8_20_14_3_00_37_11]|nr:MAG: hypothetical protein COS64_01145 [archaeon CG06_land_8_20_14_3_00_37_11]